MERQKSLSDERLMEMEMEMETRKLVEIKTEIYLSMIIMYYH